MTSLESISIGDIAATLTMLGGLVLFFWRLSVRIKASVDGQTANSIVIKRQEAYLASLHKRIAQIGRNTVQIENSIGKLNLLLAEREKDIVRLEGRMDEIGGLMLKQVSAVKEATSSLDAVWRTLQVLFPDKVPKRASDKKG